MSYMSFKLIMKQRNVMSHKRENPFWRRSTCCCNSFDAAKEDI